MIVIRSLPLSKAYCIFSSNSKFPAEQFVHFVCRVHFAGAYTVNALLQFRFELLGR